MVSPVAGKDEASLSGTKEVVLDRVAGRPCTWDRDSAGSCTPQAWGRDTVTEAPSKEPCGMSSGTDKKGGAGALGVGRTSMLPR